MEEPHPIQFAFTDDGARIVEENILEPVALSSARAAHALIDERLTSAWRGRAD